MTRRPPRTHYPSCDVLPEKIFRAYDIRGVYPHEITERNSYWISRAIATLARQQGIDSLLVACDGRRSSPVLFPALIQGLRDGGCNVVDLGIVPTPVLYFACHNTPFTSGVMLTASHNPSDHNGMKIVFHQAPLLEVQIKQLYQLVLDQDFSVGCGEIQHLDICPSYIEYISSNVSVARPLKVVVDCGNAVPGVVAPELFANLHCTVIPLFCELDGDFPNHHPDPTVASNLDCLVSKVLETEADLGVAFDGDGDRVGLVSNTGEIIDADKILMLLAKQVLPKNKGAVVVVDVKSSRRLLSLIQSLGGIPIMQRSGHSFIKTKMIETGALFGGEYAAHIFIKDRWFGFDDGLYAAARILEILTLKEQRLSDLLADLPYGISTPEITIPVPEEKKFTLIDALIQAAEFPSAELIKIDGLRVEYDDRWGLIRASNTSAALLLRFEADSVSALGAIKEEFKTLLEKVDKDIALNFS